MIVQKFMIISNSSNGWDADAVAKALMQASDEKDEIVIAEIDSFTEKEKKDFSSLFEFD